MEAARSTNPIKVIAMGQNGALIAAFL